jgi:chromosome segregation ATPase
MILFDKIVAGAAVALLVTAGVQTWRLHTNQLARAEDLAKYEAERASAAEISRQAEKAAREREQDLQAKVNQLEEKDANSAAEIAKRDARINSLAAAGRVLNDRLSDFTRARGRPEDSCPAAVDLQNRVETLGLLVREADRAAEEVGRYADDIGDELRTCRAYADAVSR